MYGDILLAQAVSGEKTWKWLSNYWFMDFWATIVFLGAILWAVAYVVIQHNEKWKIKLIEYGKWSARHIWSGIIATVFFPWLVVRGLFFTENGTPGLFKFDAFKTMFVLASFVMLFRLFIGGKTFEDFRLGPDVEDRFGGKITRVVEKIKRGKNKPQQKIVVKRYRPWLYVKKSTSQPITFYEVLVFLIFAGLFYFRHDLKEGDKTNAFDRLIEVWGYGLANKYGAGPPQTNVQAATLAQQPKTEPPKKEPDEPIIAEPSMIKKEPESKRKKKEKPTVISTAEDPFLNR